MGRKAERADEVTRDELLTDEEREAEAAAEKPAAKNGRKKVATAPRVEARCVCGNHRDPEDRLCWSCRDVEQDLVVRLAAEAFAQGLEVGEGVRRVYDWADGIVAERGRRAQARTGGAA